MIHNYDVFVMSQLVENINMIFITCIVDNDNIFSPHLDKFVY